LIKEASERKILFTHGERVLAEKKSIGVVGERKSEKVIHVTGKKEAAGCDGRLSPRARKRGNLSFKSREEEARKRDVDLYEREKRRLNGKAPWFSLSLEREDGPLKERGGVLVGRKERRERFSTVERESERRSLNRINTIK